MRFSNPFECWRKLHPDPELRHCLPLRVLSVLYHFGKIQIRIWLVRQIHYRFISYLLAFSQHLRLIAVIFPKVLMISLLLLEVFLQIFRVRRFRIKVNCKGSHPCLCFIGVIWILLLLWCLYFLINLLNSSVWPTIYLYLPCILPRRGFIFPGRISWLWSHFLLQLIQSRLKFFIRDLGNVYLLILTQSMKVKQHLLSKLIHWICLGQFLQEMFSIH